MTIITIIYLLYLLFEKFGIKKLRAGYCLAETAEKSRLVAISYSGAQIGNKLVPILQIN